MIDPDYRKPSSQLTFEKFYQLVLKDQERVEESYKEEARRLIGDFLDFSFIKNARPSLKDKSYAWWQERVGETVYDFEDKWFFEFITELRTAIKNQI